ncbi:MAG: glyoxalase [Sphingobacteriales bacterium]|nr:MAG: glyoxalase [Sphingobacteriales bacterium]
MKTTKIWANYAVADLDRTTQFYTAIGFKTNGRSEDLTSFKVGDDDFIIHFFLKDAISKNIPGMVDASQGTEIVFTLSVDSREDADQWAKEIAAAGGTLVTQPAEFGDGYYGFVFTDPDGHKFNVFYM